MIAEAQTEIEVNEDASEKKMVWTPDGYFEQSQLQEGISAELEAMKKFEVYEEVDTSTWSAEERKTLIPSRWVVVQKSPTCIRARLVCKGFKEPIQDPDSVFAATPCFSTVMSVFTVGLAMGLQFCFMDISTAFLHAAVQTEVYVQPPPEAG